MGNKIKELAEIMYQSHNREYIQNCTIEELSELTKVITKSRRGEQNIDNFTEEIGHVILMCNSLMKSYGIQECDVIKEAEDAINRMLDDKLGQK